MTTSEIQILDSSDQETDDFSDDDYYYDYNNEEEDALDGIHIRKDIDLQFDRNYVSHWKAPDAARELIQNWKDGIIVSNRLQPRDFVVEYDESLKHRVIKATACHGQTKRELGFIRFQWNRQEVGNVEIVNHGANLLLKHLRIGLTSKFNDDAQAGHHGEGMKLAALVLSREPALYGVRFRSSAFQWTFHFKRTRDCRSQTFKCTLRRLTDKQITDFTSKHNSDPKNDVAIEIGAPRGVSVINCHGNRVKPNKVVLKDFKEWLKVCLDINPPAEMIKTDHGSLILNSAYRNHLYLKGLRVCYGSCTGTDFQYGYDLRSGWVNRDRSQLSSKTESSNIAEIWSQIIMHRSFGPQVQKYDIIGKYTDLWNMESEPADVMRAAESEFVPRAVVESMWERLLRIANEDSSCPKFYFCESDGAEAKRTIVDHFKREPKPLSKRFWRLLTKHMKCRSPSEEQARRFQKAPILPLPKTSFAQHVHRALRASLKLFPMTQDLRIEIVDARGLGIHASAPSKEDQVKVSIEWFEYEAAHQYSNCLWARNTINTPEDFVCDHVIVELYRHIISEIVKPTEALDRDFSQQKQDIQNEIEMKVPFMPRAITVNPIPEGLSVSWTTGGRAIDCTDILGMEMFVSLHVEEFCHDKREHLLHYRAGNGDKDAPHDFIAGECTVGLVEHIPLGCTTAIFRGLSHHLSYFPLLALEESGFFYGLSPSSEKPLPPATDVTRSRRTTSEKSDLYRGTPSREQQLTSDTHVTQSRQTVCEDTNLSEAHHELETDHEPETDHDLKTEDKVKIEEELEADSPAVNDTSIPNGSEDEQQDLGDGNNDMRISWDSAIPLHEVDLAQLNFPYGFEFYESEQYTPSQLVFGRRRPQLMADGPFIRAGSKRRRE